MSSVWALDLTTGLAKGKTELHSDPVANGTPAAYRFILWRLHTVFLPDSERFRPTVKMVRRCQAGPLTFEDKEEKGTDDYDDLLFWRGVLELDRCYNLSDSTIKDHFFDLWFPGHEDMTMVLVKEYSVELSFEQLVTVLQFYRSTSTCIRPPLLTAPGMFAFPREEYGDSRENLVSWMCLALLSAKDEETGEVPEGTVNEFRARVDRFEVLLEEAYLRNLLTPLALLYPRSIGVAAAPYILEPERPQSFKQTCTIHLTSELKQTSWFMGFPLTFERRAAKGGATLNLYVTLDHSVWDQSSHTWKWIMFPGDKSNEQFAFRYRSDGYSHPKETVWGCSEFFHSNIVGPVEIHKDAPLDSSATVQVTYTRK